jgi:hypothetical protein
VTLHMSGHPISLTMCFFSGPRVRDGGASIILHHGPRFLISTTAVAKRIMVYRNSQTMNRMKTTSGECGNWESQDLLTNLSLPVAIGHSGS